MITRLEATRYRCFERLDVDVGDFHVLVGANGSGKTTLFDLPVLLRALLRTNNVSAPFMERRLELPPRACSLNELVFVGRRSDFSLAVEACLPEAVQSKVLEYSLGKDGIIAHVTANLVDSGWTGYVVKVIAIDSKLENWLWQDKPQVADVLGHQGGKPLYQHLADIGKWPADLKPPRPKDIAEWVLKQAKKPRSSANGQKLAEYISIGGGTDAAFIEMHAAFLTWFPMEVAV